MSEPFRFRGHSSGLDLRALVARSPELAGREGAVQALSESLTALGEQRRAATLQAIASCISGWREEARGVQRSKLRRGHSQRLVDFVARLEQAVAFVPDASAMIRRIIPGGVLVRLAWRQPEAGVDDQSLEDLKRALERRLDPALARELARDAAVREAVARVLASPDLRLPGS
jgi:hypothetical protein